MLTLEECKQLLGDVCPQSTSELERLREQLYGLAGVGVEACPRRRHGKGPKDAPDAARKAIEGAAEHNEPSSFADAMAKLSEDQRYEIEERAAIMEHNGGLDRDAAESAALSAFWRSHHQTN